MANTSKDILPAIASFEDYENLKIKIEIFENAAKEIIHRHELPIESLKHYSEGTNIVFAYGDHRVIKLFPPFHYDQFKAELLVLQHLQGKLSVQTPMVEYFGELSNWPYIVMTQLSGTLLEELWDKMELYNKIIIIRELGSLIHEVHSLSTQGLLEIDSHWPEFLNNQINACKEKHRSAFSESFLDEISVYLEEIKESLVHINKSVLLTGEYTPMNILVNQIEGVWHIVGLIDFGDSMLGYHEYDLLGPGAFLIQGDKQLLRSFLTSYGYSEEMMTPLLSHRLTALMLLHKYSNLSVQIRIKNWKNKVNTLNDLEKLVWGF